MPTEKFSKKRRGRTASYFCLECNKTFTALAYKHRMFCGIRCSNKAKAKTKTTKPLAVRFWKRVRLSAGCWLWLGPPHHNGYGNIRTEKDINGNSRLIGPHQASWLINHGPIPAGFWVLHKCDTPLCVNPDHLYLGTRADNAMDMVVRERAFMKKGSGHFLAKLTEIDIPVIRRLYTSGLSKRYIAGRYAVSDVTIHKLIAGMIWRHVG